MIAASPATNPERMPGTLERLDRLWNTTQRFEIVAPHGRGGCKQARWRRVILGIDFRIALVRGDHEIVAVGKPDQMLQGLVSIAAPLGLPGVQM